MAKKQSRADKIREREAESMERLLAEGPKFTPFPENTYDRSVYPEVTKETGTNVKRKYFLIKYKFIRPNWEGKHPEQSSWIPIEYLEQTVKEFSWCVK